MTIQAQINELRVKLRYAQNFTPHKVGYYQDLLEQAESELLQDYLILEAENNAKARAKKNFYTHQ